MFRRSADVRQRSHPYTVIMQIGLREDALDTRLVFRVYAALMGGGGFLLAGWGQIWFGSHFPGEPFGKAAIVRMWGTVLMAAACAATGAAAVDDPPSRRRALLWFAIGHTVVLVMAMMQNVAIWDGRMDWLVGVLFGIVLTLFYLWQTANGEAAAAGRPLATTLFGDGQPAADQVRSAYEHQIRAAAAQEERNRLARDLHDSIKQQIFVIQTAAATAQARFDTDPEGARAAIGQIRESSREAVSEMEAMLDQLRVAPLENVGLVEALRKHCDALGFRTGADVELDVGSLPANHAIAPGAHEALFRAAQEALANIGRHARATQVRLKLGTVGDRLQLHIQDNGAGFDPEQAPRGMGIANMRDRMREYRGGFEGASRPGAGTSIVLSIPYSLENASEYARHARLRGALLAALCLYSLWRPSVFIAAAAAIPAIGVARSLRAYLRLRAKARSAA